MRDVFIIGSKGIPARYGGFETFVEKLTAGRQSENIRYHVACMDRRDGISECHKAECFHLRVPSIGPAKAVYYDLRAFFWCLRYIRKNKIPHPIVYVLACRIGPFAGYLAKKLGRLGGVLFVNPDGHEWMRAKWNACIRRYWKISERLMVKHADLLVCDSRNIQKYIREEYAKYCPRTVFIAYGTSRGRETEKGRDRLREWYQRFGLKEGGYYLVVGRFVPENNYQTMIREFCRSDTGKRLVLVTNVEKNGFYRRLERETRFSEDQRVCFAGTVYDDELLWLIRKNAYAYLHGHEVGGTNRSLIDARSATRLNLLYDVGFNREVGGDGALYWGKRPGELKGLIEAADKMTEARREELGEKARARMEELYSWEAVIRRYESVFLGR